MSKIEQKISQTSKPKRLSQTDVPRYSIKEAIRIPKAIEESYACDPVKPLDLAAALDLSPNSSHFKMLCGAAIAYGLTTGGYNASEISITPLGIRIVRPKIEGDDLMATKEAFLKPRVIQEFVNKYDQSPLPNDNIARNVLIDMGVPDDRAVDVFHDIVNGAQELGMVTEIKGKKYLRNQISSSAPMEEEHEFSDEQDDNIIEFDQSKQLGHKEQDGISEKKDEKLNKRVFITHGKNKEFVDPIKHLLKFGELEAVVSVESQSSSKPVPDKVLGDMRTCGAAIIHVDAEMRLMDSEGTEHVKLNDNVLIEIGAAMALYGRRYILLVKEGVSLPSNLQGLYEVRYSGDALDGDATIRLMQAINSMKQEKVEI